MQLKFGQKRPLQHRTLIQVADKMFFFLFPVEILDKKKRVLKERRKHILQILQPNLDSKQSAGQHALKGQNKRLNLDEILSLWELTRGEVHALIG
jgi:hypothetical protein